jgi:hypothetical protein
MHVVERNIPNEFIIQKHRTQMNNKYPPPPNTQTQKKISWSYYGMALSSLPSSVCRQWFTCDTFSWFVCLFPGENHPHVASHWQTLSHSDVSSTQRHDFLLIYKIFQYRLYVNVYPISLQYREYPWTERTINEKTIQCP